MSRTSTVLIAACISILAAAPANSQQRPNEPTSLLCKGKAVSPTDPAYAEITLSATIDRDRNLELVLQDDKGKQEFPQKNDNPVLDQTNVRTGSLAVQTMPNYKTVSKMLWQRAGLSQDFIGFAIDVDATSVLRVDSGPYETGRSTQMPFDFYHADLSVLYRGTCVGH